jgi:hypothetical protein
MLHPIVFVLLSFPIIYLSFQISPPFRSLALASPSKSCTVTVSAQFSQPDVIPISFFFSTSNLKSIPLFHVLILLFGNIQLNSGPVSDAFNGYSLKIRSLLNPTHCTAIANLAKTLMILV